MDAADRERVSSALQRLKQQKAVENAHLRQAHAQEENAKDEKSIRPPSPHTSAPGPVPSLAVQAPSTPQRAPPSGQGHTLRKYDPSTGRYITVTVEARPACVHQSPLSPAARARAAAADVYAHPPAPDHTGTGAVLSDLEDLLSAGGSDTDGGSSVASSASHRWGQGLSQDASVDLGFAASPPPSPIAPPATSAAPPRAGQAAAPATPHEASPAPHHHQAPSLPPRPAPAPRASHTAAVPSTTASTSATGRDTPTSRRPSSASRRSGLGASRAASPAAATKPEWDRPPLSPRSQRKADLLVQRRRYAERTRKAAAARAARRQASAASAQAASADEADTEQTAAALLRERPLGMPEAGVVAAVAAQARGTQQAQAAAAAKEAAAAHLAAKRAELAAMLGEDASVYHDLDSFLDGAGSEQGSEASALAPSPAQQTTGRHGAAHQHAPSPRTAPRPAPATSRRASQHEMARPASRLRLKSLLPEGQSSQQTPSASMQQPRRVHSAKPPRRHQRSASGPRGRPASAKTEPVLEHRGGYASTPQPAQTAIPAGSTSSPPPRTEAGVRGAETVLGKSALSLEEDELRRALHGINAQLQRRSTSARRRRVQALRAEVAAAEAALASPPANQPQGAYPAPSMTPVPGSAPMPSPYAPPQAWQAWPGWGGPQPPPWVVPGAGQWAGQGAGGPPWGMPGAQGGQGPPPYSQTGAFPPHPWAQQGGGPGWGGAFASYPPSPEPTPQAPPQPVLPPVSKPQHPVSAAVQAVKQQQGGRVQAPLWAGQPIPRQGGGSATPRRAGATLDALRSVSAIRGDRGVTNGLPRSTRSRGAPRQVRSGALPAQKGAVRTGVVVQGPGMGRLFA